MESVIQAFLHFYFMDKANACVHESNVRFSPITFGLYAAVESRLIVDDGTLPDLAFAMAEMGEHADTYELDKGR